jgi:hypothetical protein
MHIVAPGYEQIGLYPTHDHHKYKVFLDGQETNDFIMLSEYKMEYYIVAQLVRKDRIRVERVKPL